MKTRIFVSTISLSCSLYQATSFLAPQSIIRYPSLLFDSVSQLTSSPERYAASMGLTIEEMEIIQANRTARSQALHETLQSSSLTGPEKHALLCQHVVAHGQHPFVCPTCWTYQPICVCRPVRDAYDIPIQQVVLWTHHDEWGSVSNTGSVLPLLLKDVSMKLKGLPEHDAWLDKLLNDPTVLPVVLWTDHNPSENHYYYSTEELLQADKPIVLIAMEGTWRNSRRMVSKLPVAGRWSLTREQVLSGASIREQGPSPEHACTAEAVVGALVALGLDPTKGASVLQLVNQKVNLTRRYQGHGWK
jgi:DTW domain-containing protein YfiP